MLFAYEHVVDVGNVTTVTISGLQEGKIYALAATAYDKDNNESAFSKELLYKVPFYLPGQAGNLQQRPLEVLKFGGPFPDPIKGEVP